MFPDFVESIASLNAEKVRYLIVGGYAVAFHARPRATKDIDLLVEPTLPNARRARKAIVAFLGGAAQEITVAAEIVTQAKARILAAVLAFSFGVVPLALAEPPPGPGPQSPAGGVACLGDMPQSERCNCADDDCDGVQDNASPNGPPLCPANQECVEGPWGCQCAEVCCGDVQWCPPGQTVAFVKKSDTGIDLGGYCVDDPCPNNCFYAVVQNAAGETLCAPPETPTGLSCAPVPRCDCKGAFGCRAPCFGVTCEGDLVCSSFGKIPGSCAEATCANVPCQTCGEACAPTGLCVSNPCNPESCPGQACKPSSDFLSALCVPSCADVDCPAGLFCSAGTCTTDLCAGRAPCTDGLHCLPATGLCGPDPCSGVICPGQQACARGECIWLDGGAACSGDADCSSGVCSAGTCCNVRCEGACVACDAPTKGYGTTGICGPVSQGGQPRGSCAATHSWTCGTTGLCDGQGQCELYADGTPCTGGGQCAAGTCVEAPVVPPPAGGDGCAFAPRQSRSWAWIYVLAAVACGVLRKRRGGWFPQAATGSQ